MLTNKINLDQYGRIILEDNDLLQLIFGAVEGEVGNYLVDGGCGNNSQCSNSSC